MSTIEIGSIFIHSWGCEQVNIDYFEVVKLTAKTATIRQLRAQQRSDGPQTMTGVSSPLPGQYTGEPTRRRIQSWEGEPVLRVDNYGSRAQLWDGTPRRFSTYA